MFPALVEQKYNESNDRLDLNTLAIHNTENNEVNECNDMKHEQSETPEHNNIEKGKTDADQQMVR